MKIIPYSFIEIILSLGLIGMTIYGTISFLLDMWGIVI